MHAVQRVGDADLRWHKGRTKSAIEGRRKRKRKGFSTEKRDLGEEGERGSERCEGRDRG